MALILPALFCFAISTYSQLTVSYPKERMVFQRNLSNSGTFSFSGSVNQIVDKLEVKIWERSGVNLVLKTDWYEIENNSPAGFFRDTITLNGGWYKLEIRATKNEIVIDTKTIERVGVGEVFIIAGQSNASGVNYYPNDLGLPANDDRVNCSNFRNSTNSIEPDLNLNFTHLGNVQYVGPFGDTQWCWGVLGDNLVQQLNVPVLFFNTAWGGTSTKHWFTSYNGTDVITSYEQNLGLTLGFPYQNLKTCLKFYGSLLGVRAVLWHQGETDCIDGILTQQQMRDQLKGTILGSRADLGENVAWMVCKASFINDYSNDHYCPAVIGAQAEIINEPGLNVFEGPNTDNYMHPRYDNVHFAGSSGSQILGDAWATKLNANFFSTCVPVLPGLVEPLDVTCLSTNNTSIQALEHYTIYKWNDNSSVSYKTGNTGIYSAFLKTNNGNYKFSQAYNLAAFNFTVPAVSAISSSPNPAMIYNGNEINLIVSCPGFQPVWSSGQINSPVSVFPIADSTFSVSCINRFCHTTSQSKQVKVCPQNLSLISPQNDIDLGHPLNFVSASVISARNVISGPLGGGYNNLIFQGEKSIELLPGFKSEGQTFTAILGSCLK